MKYLFMVLFIGFIPTLVMANCYSIRDNDLKNNCLAMDKNNSSYCYSIKDNDMKNYCLAKIQQSRSYCYSIKNSDIKNECLSVVR